MFTAVLLGFVLGLRHASDPDHVIAVSTILARHRRAWASAAVGAAWGLGHSATIVAVGALIVLLQLAVPPRVGLGLELVVGIVLVALGLRNLRDMGAESEAAHGHVHELRDAGAATTAALARACGVGLVHGLAGSAAVALLALAAMPTPATAIAYLAVFSVGTIGGMVAISLGLGFPLAFAARRPVLRRFIVAGSGALSLGFGAWLVYDIGFVQGLLAFS
ncbi:MAG TPA: high-affinity nickel-transport family protein [Myxococcota bacterium]|nr:high-affinity nickel-transport family protein [Myxococcota bacterium]